MTRRIAQKSPPSHHPSTRQRSGVRRTVASSASTSVIIDDRPLAIQISHDGKRLMISLPFEVWIVQTSTLQVERSISVPAERPCVWEAEQEHDLWIGGHLLYYGNMFQTSYKKIGSKLGGYVDYIALIRPNLLCGIGSQGEILWNIAKEEVIHRRKTGEKVVRGLVASRDGRAIWTDGSPNAWVIDPDHPSGYTQLRLRSTSVVSRSSEDILSIGMTFTGRCILAARDGAIAWTNPQLRFENERFPRIPETQAYPLAVAGDERWVYVLRPNQMIQRFLIEQPPSPKDENGEDEEVQPLPEAQECRLPWPADCLLLWKEDSLSQLVLGAPHAEGMLGRLWRCDPDSLSWSNLKLSQRKCIFEAPPTASEEAPKQPSFIATKTKIKGPPLAELKVDQIFAENTSYFITPRHGNLLERPVSTCLEQDIMPGDAILLPTMLRLYEGTARPALLLWPGVPEAHNEIPPWQWLVWGDKPRGWMLLTTPNILEQGWSRTELFPMQIALLHLPYQAAGHRAEIPSAWLNPHLFHELADECKKLLKVIW